MSPNDAKRGGKGRRKIEIKPIVEAGRRQVCFSKRRQGLFKKAVELCILCGAEVAILFVSPAGKPYTYGHPSMKNVVARFLNGAGPSKEAPTDHCDEMKLSLAYWSDCLETEKRRRGQLEAALNAPWPIPKPFWWDADVSSMTMPELMECRRALLQQQYKVALAEQQYLNFQEQVAEKRPVDLAVFKPFLAGMP